MKAFDVRHDDTVSSDEQTAWQRQYDASLAQARQDNDDDESTGEVIATESTFVGAMWLPAWAGLAVIIVTGLLVAARRKRRRHAEG